jgi:hypothetical protein
MTPATAAHCDVESKDMDDLLDGWSSWILPSGATAEGSWQHSRDVDARAVGVV